MQMSPSQRQAEDAKRVQARLLRRGHNPGPAHYSPQQLSVKSTSTLRELAGLYAFKSTAVRSDLVLQDKGDPGEYSPMIYLSLANGLAAKSFNRSASDGFLKSGFGGQADRVLDLGSDQWNEGEKTPGPAAYNPVLTEKGKEFDMSVREGAETMQSAVFASKAPRIGDVFTMAQEQLPGPGAYDPNDKMTINHLPGANPESNILSQVGRDSRFTSDLVGRQEHLTPPDVGPGAYDSHVINTLEKSLAATLERSSNVQKSNAPGKDAIGFGARYMQRELPHESLAANASKTPGPGAYTPLMTEQGKEADMGVREGSEKMASSSFVKNNIKTSIINEHMGDPGAYNPYENRNLVDQSRQTFHKAAKEGRANFGASTARTLRIPPDMLRGGTQDVTPGPAAYTSITHRVFEGASAVFKSLVPQRAKIALPNADIPAPNAYNPNDKMTISHLPGANPDSNILSQVGRDSRFSGDQVGRQEHVTPPDVGPGKYDSHVIGTIEQAQSKVEDKSDLYKPAHKDLSTKLGFSGSAVNHMLPHEREIKYNENLSKVGPGQYDPYAHTDIAATARASYSRPAKEGKGNFGSNDAARASVGLLLTPVKDVGDPGAYSPEANKGIAATARSFFGRSNLAGVGGFGAVSRRIFRLEGPLPNGSGAPGFKADVTPGPAAYNPVLTEKGKEFDMSVREGAETMQSAVFASKAPRIGDVFTMAQEQLPGPGAYDPNDKMTINHLPGANPESNILSQVGRDSRFTSDLVGRQEHLTPPDVGPGAYEPKVTNDGELSTLGSRVDHQTSLGWTANFLSTHIRSLWQGWFGDDDTLVSA